MTRHTANRHSRSPGTGPPGKTSGSGVRADWQANLRHTTGSGIAPNITGHGARPILYPGSCLITGKTDDGEPSRSDIFDNFRYIRVNLATDDNMLPPNLRGYAPEVTGVAKPMPKYRQ